MTSAFTAPLQRQAPPDRPGFRLFSVEENNHSKPRDIESETEDEEVKINCMGGFRGGTESDMYSSDEETDDDDDEEDIHEIEGPSVPNFVSDCITTPKRLVRPRATSIGKRLSPLQESSEEPEESECSVGARGVPLSVDGDLDEDSDDEASTASSACLKGSKEQPPMMQESTDHDSSDSESEESSFADAEDGSQSDSEEEEDSDSETDDDDDDEVIAEKKETGVAAKIVISSSEDETAIQDESHSADEGGSILIGVSRDCSTPKNTPRVKRELSSNSLARYTYLSSGIVEGSPKRMRSDSDIPLVSLSLEDTVLTESNKVHVASFRCPSTSGDEQEEVIDGQLREELDGYHSDCREPNSPVPLLTPPASPQPTSTICEWPSNLVVDSAMTAVMTEIRPLSPISTENSEVADPSKAFSDGTTLTPLLRSLVMEKDFLIE